MGITGPGAAVGFIAANLGAPLGINIIWFLGCRDADLGPQYARAGPKPGAMTHCCTWTDGSHTRLSSETSEKITFAAAP